MNVPKKLLRSSPSLIELQTNETLLIDKDGKFEKFANEFAGADSLWLTACEIWINNVDIPTLINRMAISFGCKVQYNYQPSDERIVNVPGIHFDCKSGSLLDSLQQLQTIATDSQKFSYYVKNCIIFIGKYRSHKTYINKNVSSLKEPFQ